MNESRISMADTLQGLPPEWGEDPSVLIRSALRVSGEKVVVLDDDPTGTQTVHGIPVLTEWPVETLRSELANDLPAFYLLTNSRSLFLEDAKLLNAEIGHNLLQASRRERRKFVVVSRSDSTLRGHFPGEVDALAKSLEHEFDAWLIIPFFKEGGRYTINDIHYVAEGDWLVPAGETAYARDATFGYRASNLRQWVAEKTAGRIPMESVASISIDDLRLGGPERVKDCLLGLAKGSVCVVNAASYRDLEVFTAGLLSAEAQGRHFLYRTAASFVPIRAGISPRPLLSRGDLEIPDTEGAIFIVGSYVPKTSIQISHLLDQGGVMSVEVQVKELLSGDRYPSEVQRVAGLADSALRSGENVVIFTSRGLITGDDAESSLAIGQTVSKGLIDILLAIPTRPRYILAKGGITSSDVATKGLGVKRAMVAGQILPGVPVWLLGPESRFPGLTYIVFPGNVGGPDALVKILGTLNPEEKE